MSRPVTEMVQSAGAWLYPDAPPPRQMMLGMEVLHLIGNSIFLATILGVWALTHSRWAKYAFVIEGLHLCEHIALFLTAYYIGKPIGVSTLFGQSAYLLGSKEAAVGYRVSWHFAMNLLPLPFVMMALMDGRSVKPAGLRAAA
jgi:hypothetical protein